MDSVRFGRALGFGARSAAKALSGAVDAATAPNPTTAKRFKSDRPAASQAPPPSQGPVSPSTAPRPNDPVASAARAAAHVTARAQVSARETTKGVARGSKRFGESVLGPLSKLSKVLWLEMTGAFFGLFALFGGQAVWNHRADLHSTAANHEGHIHFLVFVLLTAVFSYFCLSSFFRAYRK